MNSMVSYWAVNHKETRILKNHTLTWKCDGTVDSARRQIQNSEQAFRSIEKYLEKNISRQIRISRLNKLRLKRLTSLTH